MKTGQAGIALIKSFEGCKLVAYKPVPTEKEYTIGWGHYGVKAGTKWTQQQADEQLIKDLVKYENHVNALKRTFNQNEFDALVSFCYNCGQGNLQSLCKNRSNKQIAEAILKYNKAGGKELAGLTKRRKAERELFIKVINVTVPQKIKTLPYEVKTTCALNIRTAAGLNYPIVRVAKRGEKLKVWAECTSDGKRWGKNGNEWYCLEYCEEI